MPAMKPLTRVNALAGITAAARTLITKDGTLYSDELRERSGSSQELCTVWLNRNGFKKTGGTSSTHWKNPEWSAVTLTQTEETLCMTVKELGEIIDLTEDMMNAPNWVKGALPFAKKRMSLINAIRKRAADGVIPFNIKEFENWLVETPFPQDSQKIVAQTLKKICLMREEGNHEGRRPQ